MVGAKEESKPPAPVITPLPPVQNSAQTQLLLSRFPDPGLLSKPDTRPLDFKPSPPDYSHTLFHSNPLVDTTAFTSKIKSTGIVPSQDTTGKVPTVISSATFVPPIDTSYPSTTMELHDSSGALLPSFSVNPDQDQTQQSAVAPNVSAPQVLPTSSPHANTHIHNLTPNPQDITATTQQDVQNDADIRTQPIVTSTTTTTLPSLTTQQDKKLEPMNSNTDTTQAGADAASVVVAAQALAQSNSTNTPTSSAGKKPSRMPGTKQCPACQSTIAAAVAKCPHCSHIFREKKEKIKRSGKRGKKNCPKCKYENPSACSSCKSCKYVFRLKLMDKYKQLRSRQQQNESEVAAAAAAAHAAANMAHNQHSAVSAVSTVPLPAGVTAYPSHIGQQIHPNQVMPPLTQHPMTLHPHVHNVHATSMPQIHHLPHHTMHQNQTHPQL